MLYLVGVIQFVYIMILYYILQNYKENYDNASVWIKRETRKLSYFLYVGSKI